MGYIYLVITAKTMDLSGLVAGLSFAFGQHVLLFYIIIQIEPSFVEYYVPNEAFCSKYRLAGNP
jgi:hypothetical protein